MAKRYVAIWFRHLKADWLMRRQPALREVPFVIAAPVHGRMVIQSVSAMTQQKGIGQGMVVADCRAIVPALQVFEDKPGQDEKLLNALAEWCLRYTPAVGLDMPGGLMLDVSGCPHLWGGEMPYLVDIAGRLRSFGYDVRAAMADTIGTAWAIARFGQSLPIIEPSRQAEALLPLPADALRLEPAVSDRLKKLGLYKISSFIHMPRKALNRRFGPSLLMRLDQALGQEYEAIVPIQPVEPYQERLPCLDPVRTAAGIGMALRQLLEKLCHRLAREEKGLRKCILKAYRIDGNIQCIEIGTNRPTRKVDHLYRLFELKIPTITPALGIEVFTLEAPVVEAVSAAQYALYASPGSSNGAAIPELLDRIAGKFGADTVHRYLPDEHYWPERSIKNALSLAELPQTIWRAGLPRPIHLLPAPEPIEVTVPMPDYPPMLFRYKGGLHHVRKADGPERIEQEWWLAQGQYRDYYCVEDEHGARYWLFRLGSYETGTAQWFIHGFFA